MLCLMDTGMMGFWLSITTLNPQKIDQRVQHDVRLIPDTSPAACNVPAVLAEAAVSCSAGDEWTAGSGGSTCGTGGSRLMMNSMID